MPLISPSAGGAGLSVATGTPPAVDPRPSSPAIIPGGTFGGAAGTPGIIAAPVVPPPAPPGTHPPLVAPPPVPPAPPPVAVSPGSAPGAIAGWLAADDSFAATFPGGLYYAAAPAGVDSPYVVFGLDSTQVVGLIGRPEWSESQAFKFEVWDSGDTSDGSEVAAAAETLSTILFGTRGAAQDPIEFAGGRIVRRRGKVAEIGIAPGMGRGGADMFRATIEATLLVARDG